MLTIDDSSTGTIRHYGSAGELNIIQCHTASYHEYGTVAFAEIAKGRIVLEKGSEIKQLHINANVQGTAFDKVIIAKSESVEMPVLSRDDVVIDETNGTLVVTIQNGTETITESTELDYIWLTKQGIYEQIKVSDNAESAGDVWADDESNSVTTQTAAQQIANNIGRNANNVVETKVTVGTTEYTVTLDENRNLVAKDSENNVVDSAEVATAVNNAVEKTGLTEEQKEEAKAEAIVEAANLEISLDVTELTLGSKETATITATVTTSANYSYTLTWVSSNPAVATVDENGKVTGVGLGSATITAAAGPISAECTVQCYEKNVMVSGIMNNKVRIGSPYTFNAWGESYFPSELSATFTVQAYTLAADDADLTNVSMYSDLPAKVTGAKGDNPAYLYVYKVEKTKIENDTYRYILDVDLKDAHGNKIEIKPGKVGLHEYLKANINLYNIEAGYSISGVSVNGKELTSGVAENLNEYWVSSSGLSFTINQLGLIEILMTKNS